MQQLYKLLFLIPCTLGFLLIGASCSLLVDPDRFDTSGEPSPPDAAQSPDAPADAPPVVCDGRTPLYFDLTELDPVTGDLDMRMEGEYRFHTDDLELLDPEGGVIDGLHTMAIDQDGGPQLALLLVNSLVLDRMSFLLATGSRPLAIASLTTMDIRSSIDVSSQSGMVGAGGNPDGCDFTEGNGQDGFDESRGSGGGGGGFRGRGGLGGQGSSGDRPAAGRLVAMPDVLRGGCSGGMGGGPDTELSRGGDGGGGLYLFACQSIRLIADLEAGGSGGGGGSNASAYGGGGGGSGGLVVIDAPELFVPDAEVAAMVNVRGGGGGGGSNFPLGGDDGGDGSGGGEGRGGSSGIGPGDGGDGSPDADGADGGPNALLNQSGAGGGGGGAGWVVVHSGPR